jgi:hypothetical protein
VQLIPCDVCLETLVEALEAENNEEFKRIVCLS